MHLVEHMVGMVPSRIVETYCCGTLPVGRLELDEASELDPVAAILTVQKSSQGQMEQRDRLVQEADLMIQAGWPR